MADFQVTLRSPLGAFSEPMDDFLRLQYSLVENGVGLLEGVWPPTHDDYLFNGADIVPDAQLTVARRVGGGPFVVEGEAGWLIRYGRQTVGANGERTTTLRAVPGNDLLRRRIVAYAAGSAEADYAAQPADDAMKQIVYENLGAGAARANANISSYLSIQPDLSQGASIAKAFARRSVLGVLQEYAQASALAGKYLAFDTVALGRPGQFQFRTYLGQRGVDRRLNGGAALNFGPQFGNLLNASIEFDHLAEVTSVYAGGLGEESARAIGTATDPARIALSPFNLCEQFIDSRFTDDTAVLDNEAEYALRNGIYKIIVSGQLQDTVGCQYGQDYAWGDYLTLQVGNVAADCRLSVVMVTLENGRAGHSENLQAYFKGEVA